MKRSPFLLRAAGDPPRRALSLALAGIAAVVGHGTARAADACTAASTRLVAPVVELYTSEGCNSCPPADRWLSKLKADPTVVALAFHVDYWDRLGWKDRFASAAPGWRAPGGAAGEQRPPAGAIRRRSSSTVATAPTGHGRRWRCRRVRPPPSTSASPGRATASSPRSRPPRARRSGWRPTGRSPNRATSPPSRRARTMARRCTTISSFATTSRCRPGRCAAAPPRR